MVEAAAVDDTGDSRRLVEGLPDLGCGQRRVRRDHAAVVTAEMEGRCKRLGEAAPIREDEVLPRRRR